LALARALPCGTLPVLQEISHHEFYRNTRIKQLETCGVNANARKTVM
jgi:hypothetical protein